MTFRDLRSGCCSTIRTPATRELVKTLPLQRIASSQRNFLTGPHTFIAISFDPHLTSRLGSDPNAIKASVPKLFNCPGATKLLFTPSQEIGWLVIAASRDRSKNLQHHGIAPSGLVSRLRHIKAFASSASACTAASRLPRSPKI